MELKPHGGDVFIRGYILLIVPYGIETKKWLKSWKISVKLLIVPYGIETHVRTQSNTGDRTFNRTLWN